MKHQPPKGISNVETLPMDLSPIAQSFIPQGTQPAQPHEAAQQPEAVEEEQGDPNGKEEGVKNQNKVEVEVQNKDQTEEQQAKDEVPKVTGPSTAKVNSVLDLPEAGLFKAR